MQLNSARMRASELSTRVDVPGTALRVTRVAIVSGAGTTAFIVDVRNPSVHPVGDLPISVGVRLSGRRTVYLNSRSGLDDFYFDAHLPVVAPGRSLTWVYTLHRRLPTRARPFAIVGAVPVPPVPGSTRLPEVRATPLRWAAGARGAGRAPATPVRLTVAVDNLSSIPQYQLQVYAFAVAGGRYVAAGSLTVPQLDGQQRETLDLSLVGSRDRGRLEVEAGPTILQ